jgi:hypothetical protein
VVALCSKLCNLKDTNEKQSATLMEKGVKEINVQRRRKKEIGGYNCKKKKLFGVEFQWPFPIVNTQDSRQMVFDAETP